ncbi:hypothetical protein SNE40_014846 [Patella caerulea]|uniref:C2 domain-containing protein n=1 Tax=Patella caerulea TaxID=87958 RepID=A0AAN8PR53_PATCE
MPTSSGAPGFIRVKLLKAERGETMDTTNDDFDPYMAINVKETVDIPGRGIELVQKKKTLYPDWNSCFDAHLYDGRVINMVVMERPTRFLAEISIGAKVLADKCVNGNVTTVWLDLRPSGRLEVQVRYFPEKKEQVKDPCK